MILPGAASGCTGFADPGTVKDGHERREAFSHFGPKPVAEGRSLRRLSGTTKHSERASLRSKECPRDQLVRRSLSSRIVMITPSELQSNAMEPPSWPDMPRLSKLLPNPLFDSGALTRGPPVSVQMRIRSRPSMWHEMSSIPAAAESEPYLSALVASSWIARVSVVAAARSADRLRFVAETRWGSAAAAF